MTLEPTRSDSRVQPIPIEFSVVSGSNPQMLLDCLESLYRTLPTLGVDVTVTAVCNQPGSDLPTRLRERFPDLRIIVNEQPRGFAANHNTVLRHSKARYVWIINDDLVFHANAVARVTDFLEAPANARVAAVSPKLLNADGSMQPCTYGFPSMPQLLLAHSGIRGQRFVEAVLKRAGPYVRRGAGRTRFWAHDRTIDVDTMRGACVAMRMSAVAEIGLMHEVALVGAEETEWHRRFSRHHWRVVFFAGAEVTHFGSQTVSADPRLMNEYLKGALHYFRVDRSRLTFALFCLAMAVMFGTSYLWAVVRDDGRGRSLALQKFRTSLAALGSKAGAAAAAII